MEARMSLKRPRGRGKAKIGTAFLDIKFDKKPDQYIAERMDYYGLKPETEKHYKGTFSDSLMSIVTLFSANGINPILDTGLGMAYIPATEKGFTMNVDTPDAMAYEIHIALRKLKQSVGSIHQYVKGKLEYATTDELLKSLASEQIDAVALAIYNIEKKKQGIIIGDQTGIGKGRQAAAILRYAVKQGKKPIFLTEKPNLFSDLYRDLVDIGSADLVPFIVNSKDGKTNITDFNGMIVHSAPRVKEQNQIFESSDLKGYDFVLATYSQFRDKGHTSKKGFLESVAIDNVIVMDESHNASGNSNSGEFLQEVAKISAGIVFLSATFAKRADNMPIYALKTSMSDAAMTNDQLIEAVEKGGNALQEVISSQLVADGQMIRRERTFEGITIETKIREEKRNEHWKKADQITEIIRDIIKFQQIHIDGKISEMNDALMDQYVDVINTKGTKEAGINNGSAFSRVFNMVNQLLLALKADDAAAEAIIELEAGKKPVIALANTMGAALDDLGENGDVVNADFKAALMRAFDTVMKYTVKTPNSKKGENKSFTFDDLDPDGQKAYLNISNKIKKLSSGLHLSPIDYIMYRIREAGFTVEEITGRSRIFEYTKKKERSYKIPTTGKLVARKKIAVFELFNRFNNNEIDCLIINQSGSTGASAHAKPTAVVSEKDLKARIMIGLQSEFNINTEIQKMGRINRTGQLLLPSYRNLATTIPAEQRLVMMMQSKLKSLNANTSSNQKQNKDMIVSPDFLNKYGDKVVAEYLKENSDVAKMIDLKDFDKISKIASKASGRFAILPVAMQDKVYKEIFAQYFDYVEYLKQNGEYDLEMTDMPLEAALERRSLLKVGTGTKSSFGSDTFLDRCKVNNLRKPYTKEQILKILEKGMKSGSPEEEQKKLSADFKKYSENKFNEGKADIEEAFKAKLNSIDDETRRQKAIDEHEERIHKLELQVEHHYNHLNSFFRFYRRGMSVKLPSIGDFSGQVSKGIFLGYQINMKANNPFALSNVKLRFAVADSRKYLVLSCSGEMGQTLERIRGFSYGLDKSDISIVGKDDVYEVKSPYDKNFIDFAHDKKASWQGVQKTWNFDKKEVKEKEIKDALDRIYGDDGSGYIEKWDDLIKSKTVDRVIRYIITGNILQAYAKDMAKDGKLTNYTMKDGSVMKGIIMPETWSPSSDKSYNDNFISVPIIKALPFVMSLTTGKRVYNDSQDISILKSKDDTWEIITPQSGKYKSIYLDEKIIKASSNKRDGFEKVSGVMKASFDDRGIRKAVQTLQDHGLSVSVAKPMYDTLVSGKDEKEENQAIKDLLTKRAEEMYEEDRRNYKKRLEAQRKASKKQKSSGVNIDKVKVMKLKLQLRLRISELAKSEKK